MNEFLVGGGAEAAGNAEPEPLVGPAEADLVPDHVHHHPRTVRLTKQRAICVSVQNFLV